MWFDDFSAGVPKDFRRSSEGIGLTPSAPARFFRSAGAQESREEKGKLRCWVPTKIAHGVLG